MLEPNYTRREEQEKTMKDVASTGTRTEPSRLATGDTRTTPSGDSHGEWGPNGGGSHSPQQPVSRWTTQGPRNTQPTMR